MGSWIVDSLLTWFAQTVVGILNTLWDLLATTVFVSPDVTVLPQVTAFARTSTNIVNGCYVLAFLWVAILVAGRGTIQSTVGPGELIPRLIVGLIAANFATQICAAVIQGSNALIVALTDRPIAGNGAVQQLRDLTVAALTSDDVTSPGGFLLLAIGVIIAVLTGMLLVQWIVRLGLLIVAVGVAPIALALHGIPQTDALAKTWWRTLLGALTVIVLQAVALHLTLSILLDPQANLPMLGLGDDTGEVINLFVILCLLLGIIRIPALMRRFVAQPRTSTIGTIVRVAVIQQLTRNAQRVLSRAVAPTRDRSNHDGTWLLLTRPSAQRPLPRPSGAGPGRVGVAYPTGRPVRPYTREELAGGVDVYTRALKRRGDHR
ncbi:hypothetical protein [Cryptosporangium arvum]|uniref:Uncharacterized protein n=1 Tax=Cryptosporangium arvum DSM 44712 TaxID=927661 RepID=A0A010YP93_9ACTN|nr:hypothetical protein [Cryptosporangium arvum]EXG82010.1 hypothetical protein CryarDRAFT_3141 [Cryptosporangium arvum DSM 44712]